MPLDFFRPTWSRFVLVCLALHVERLGAQPVQGALWPKAASDFVASNRRPCPNGIDHESCQHLQYAVSGAAAPTARRTSDSSTVGMGAIPITVNRLLHSIEAKRPKVGWECNTYPSYFKTLLIESHFSCNQFGRDRRRSHEIGKGEKRFPGDELHCEYETHFSTRSSSIQLIRGRQTHSLWSRRTESSHSHPARILMPL